MLSQVDEIKERLDIVQVISEYLQLKKVGANYKASCPFHSEKTPSFYVSPSRQIFKCFGCGQSGDIFKFVMAIDGVEFKEALQILARKAGVEIKKEPIQKRTERQRQCEICDLAARFFSKQLDSSRIGKEAKKYLLSRSISENSIKEWRLGYAPDTWRGISDFLISRGYKREEVIKSGLAIKNEGAFDSTSDSSSYDRFRGRIMFPIFDLSGQAVGFTGRVFKKKEEQAKYVNTPNTLLYDKSRVLYGLDRAKLEIRKKDACILVEGQTDVILSRQSGADNVVASSGTSLTFYQLKIISRYTKNLLLAFDMDVAGEAATKKGIDIAQSLDFDIKIIALPESKDPADVIKENFKQWQKKVDEAKEIINFYFEQSINRFDKKGVKEKKKISEILLPFISRIQNKIEQAHWISKLAMEIDIREEAIWEQIKKEASSCKSSLTVSDGVYEIDKLSDKKPESQQRKIEERLLMLLLKFPANFKKIKSIPKFSFNGGEKLFKALGDGQEVPKELAEFVSELELEFEVENERGREMDIQEEIQFCLMKMRNILTQEEKNKIVKKIKEVEKLQDKNKRSKLLEKLRKL